MKRNLISGGKYLSFLILLLFINDMFAETIKIAVAANYYQTLSEVSRKFEAESGHKILISSGSTGKHYTQIIHGAPFDLFFAADAKRPELLEKNGQIVAGSRFTYAVGQIVLWSPDSTMINPQIGFPELSAFSHFAIANPKLAPYGFAAKEVLMHLKKWDLIQKKIVRGENIGQTYQYVKSGNADIALVAYSQVYKNNRLKSGSGWVIPREWYSPIKQQAVVLKNNKIALQFLKFLQKPDVIKIIESYGYIVP